MSAPVQASPQVNGHRHTPQPLFETSPTFQMAMRQLATVAEHTDIDSGVLERLAHPKRSMLCSRSWKSRVNSLGEWQRDVARFPSR